MEQPQLEEAASSAKCMDPDLTSVMGWALLLKISSHMDTAGRSNWRLVSKAACQAVYDSTTALAPRKGSTDDTTAALLPQVLARCRGLKRLDCSHPSARIKRLTSLMNPIMALVVNCAPDIRWTGLAALQLPRGLESLDISWTDVRDLSFIASCTSLKRLAADSVAGCRGLESRQLAAVLQQLPGLTALQLHGNKLCVDAARDVAAVLQTLTALQELDTGRCGVPAAAALFQAVPHLQGMRRLNLTDCRLGGPALLPAILQLTALQQLRLNGNDLRADGAAMLAPALQRLQQLQVLHLSDNPLGDEGVSAMAPAIQQLTRLTALDLGNLGSGAFGVPGTRALAPALRHLTRLQHLQLHGSYLGPEGAALLAPALQDLTGLQRLCLDNMALGTEGAAALAPALQRLVALQQLVLGGNALGPAGLQALLPAIQQLVHLHSLFLHSNTLDREGTLEFAAAIQQLTGLQLLLFGVRVGNARDTGMFQQELAAVVHTLNPGCKVKCIAC